MRYIILPIIFNILMQFADIRPFSPLPKHPHFLHRPIIPHNITNTANLLPINNPHKLLHINPNNPTIQILNNIINVLC